MREVCNGQHGVEIAGSSRFGLQSSAALLSSRAFNFKLVQCGMRTVSVYLSLIFFTVRQSPLKFRTSSTEPVQNFHKWILYMYQIFQGSVHLQQFRKFYLKSTTMYHIIPKLVKLLPLIMERWHTTLPVRSFQGTDTKACYFQRIKGLKWRKLEVVLSNFTQFVKSSTHRQLIVLVCCRAIKAKRYIYTFIQICTFILE